MLSDNKELTVEENIARKTHIAYLWIHALSTPMWALFNMLPYILYKDLHASYMQTALIVTLKPLVSLFSIYWSAPILQRSDRLLPNIIWARVLGLLPFFFFPFVDNIWYFIAAHGVFMLLARGVIPAWMEILKINLPKLALGKTFASGSLIGYFGNICLPFVIGPLLDHYFQIWRWLFPLAALISLSAIFISAKIPLPQFTNTLLEPPNSKPLWKAQLSAPWKNLWYLLRSFPNFRKFQWGFMLGGAGTMIAHPILPEYFVDVLKLSYTDMSVAIACCKGIGFMLTTPFWTRFLHRVSMFQFNSWPPLCICIFTGCLLLAQFHFYWVFIAYLCYGVMQAGSEMGWNLSGPIFAKEADSSRFSNVNVLTVGVRGCIIPPIGALLGAQFGLQAVIITGGILCLLASFLFRIFSKEEEILMQNPHQASP